MANYGMVIDLTRCAGCLTCVVACQLTNNQRPGVAWGTVETVETGTWPDSDRVFLPHACMHCEVPACVGVCSTGASYQREDGIVLINYEACIGCGTCAEACPYGARKASMEEVWYFDAESPAPYEALAAHPAGVTEKCIFCAERIDQGLTTMCTASCPMGARIFGDVDDPASEISTYIKETNATNIAGTSLYYVKGDHTVDLASILMKTALEPPAKEQTTQEKSDEGVSPVVIGSGVAAVAVAAVAVGVGVKKSNDKKKAQNEKGGE